MRIPYYRCSTRLAMWLGSGGHGRQRRLTRFFACFYVFESAHALPLQTVIISRTELCWDRAIDSATGHWGGVIVGLRSAGASAYSLHSPHQLLYPDIQRCCQGDERAQARGHRGTTGAGLAFLKLLVGVGGDAPAACARAS